MNQPDRDFVVDLERELRANGALDGEVDELLKELDLLSKLPVDRAPPLSRPRLGLEVASPPSTAPQ